MKAYISMYKHGHKWTHFISYHANNIKRGEVHIYYSESLPVRVISLSYLKEALLLEMTYNNKKVIVSVIYRSPRLIFV